MMWRPLKAVSGLLVVVVIAAMATSTPEAADSRARPGEPTACPETGRHPGHTRYPALEKTLVPGEPRRLRLCQYAGMHGPLQASRLLDRRTPRIVRLLNRLPQAPRGPINCTAEEGTRFIARFGYAVRREAIVRIDTVGCRGVSNGSQSRLATRRPGGRLIDKLFAVMR